MEKDHQGHAPPSIEERALTRSPLRRLIEYARGHRRDIWLAATFSVLNKVFDLAPPLLIGAAVDIVVERQESLIARFGVRDVEHQLYVLAVATLVIWGVESLFEYLYAVRWRNLAQRVQHELRHETYAHVQRLDLATFENAQTGHYMAVLNDDINQLERFLDGGANDLIQVTTTVIVIGAIFFALAPSVAWFAFLPMPIVLWGSFHFQHRLTPRYADVRERVAEMNAALANSLGGITTIKSFTAETFEESRIERVSKEYEVSNRRAIRLSSAFSPLIRMAIVVGFVLTLILGGRAVFAGTLAVGAYSVMVFLTQRLLWPLTRLGSTIDLYQRAMASTVRVLDLLHTPIRVRGGDRRIDRGGVRGDIRLDHVTFGYGVDGVPVLRDVSLHVPAGRNFAIVGSTGAGKSTIVKLLLRFYEPQEGVITLDGTDLRHIELGSLRRAIGLVSQDVFLFHGTVRDNIHYGTFDAPHDAVVAAAQAAEADAFIRELPRGYDTIVGERGQKLSGGQRQRISIARAVLKDPPILILDEATSAVDNETEAAIQRSMVKVAAGRTTIMIAHRLSTIRHADRIVVLSKGEIETAGTHDELIRADGTYADLWRVQTGEQSLKATT